MNEAKKFLTSLLSDNDTVVVATSGGPDSMCLLHMLLEYKEKYNLKIICAHVNHGLRKESEEEKTFVENYSINNNIIFEYKKLEKYKENKFSESDARKERYKFLDEVRQKYNAKYLFTAHHGDDLIETVLMKIVRGSNLKGYVGIPKIKRYQNYAIVRPLLYVAKEDIYSYLKQHNISFVVDKSNNSQKYTRNRFRKHMLPFLKNEDKNVHLKFLKYSETLEKSNNYIEKIIDEKIDNIYVDNVIKINELLKEDKFIIERIIMKVIEDIQKKYLFNINDIEFNSILKLLKSKENRSINLANNFIARKSYNNLFLEKNKESRDFEYIFNGYTKVNNYVFEEGMNNLEKSNFIIRLDSSEIKLPIIIRNKKDGDKIKVKNLKGTKKVKDIFIDSKVDSKKREEFPVVVDSNNIVLWLPGLKKSIFDKEIDEKYDIIIKCTEEKL